MPVDTLTVPTDATVPAVVEQALARCDQAYGAALRMPCDSHIAEAVRADALAEACQARAAWWRVLLRWMFTAHCPLSWIFGAAVLQACKRDESSVRFWRKIAASEHAEHSAELLDQLPAVGGGS